MSRKTASSLLERQFMDNHDKEKFAAIYRMLADVLDRPREVDIPEAHASYMLGDLMRRLFVGTRFEPPDDLLENAANVLRTGDTSRRRTMADHLREHAAHMDELRQHPKE